MASRQRFRKVVAPAYSIGAIVIFKSTIMGILILPETFFFHDKKEIKNQVAV
jgi:hypothetical protein